MGNVLNPEPLRYCHFAAVPQSTTNDDGVQYTTHILVIRDDETDAILGCTGLEYYSAPYAGNKPQYRKTESKPYLYHVAHALNYIFKYHWWDYGITRLSDVTIDILHDVFDDYVYEPRDNGKYRSQQSIDTYIKAVSNFFANLSVLVPNCKVTPTELFRGAKIERKRERYTDTVTLQTPTYRGKAQGHYETMLLRDTYPDAIDILVSLAEIHDPMLVFALVAMDSAGLRSGEVVNMRQACSPISNTPGIMFSYVGDVVTNAIIDVSNEYQMRADAKSPGKIKKHKPAKIYPPFLPRFLAAYEFHMRLLSKIDYDKDYCPMFVDSRGNAMSRSAFRRRLRLLIDDHWVPALMQSGKPHLVAYAQELQILRYRSHALRHHFTCKLVLAGLSASMIADYRRDRNLQSAEVYIRNKRVIADQLRKVHDYAINDIISHADLFRR